MKDITVIYDKNCPDGFSGAWVTWKKFGDEAEYIPFKDHDKVPDIEDKEIYIIDFSFTESALRQIKEKNKKVIILNHHESAAEYEEKIADEFRYDPEKAACTVAWEYFFPESYIPQLLKYVEDADLWKFQIPYSEEIGEVIESIGFGDFEKWNRLVKAIEDEEKREEKIKLGKTLLEYKRQIIKELVNLAYKVKFEGHEILAVNSPSSNFRSQLGHALAEKNPPFSIIWRREKEGTKVSLRSNGEVDVSKIAKKYGGGGHPEAASFFIPQGEEMPWKHLS